MYDLRAALTLHHTSLCEALNVQLQHSSSGDRRLFPSKRQRGLRGFLSSATEGAFYQNLGTNLSSM